MRIGIYNLYWSTFGGGELQAGGVVDALSATHDVELLGPEPFDFGRARERLGLRLEDVTFRQVHGEEVAASLASADYDLFINHTYRSEAANLAPRGIYFVMFPHQLEQVGRKAALSRRLAGHLAAPLRLVGGVHVVGGVSKLVGPTKVQLASHVVQASITLRAPVPDTVTIAGADGAGSVTRHRVEGTVTIDLPPGAHEVLLSPSLDATQIDLKRAIDIVTVTIDGREVDPSPISIAQRLVPVRSRGFLATYDTVSANSPYTARWTKQWWGVDSEVVLPPVSLRERGAAKERTIVSIGRFFGDGGHSKRQLEMVKAFRLMVQGGLTGWRLVLIGGCSPEHRDYAMAVRKEAEGLPVEVRLSAPGSFVDGTLSAASIYWHAAGLGSDLDAFPERAEHFGIAPIEAMSAGAVPVVFAAGGPAATVVPEQNGLHFTTLEGLAAQTRRLIADPALLARLADGAVASSAFYSRARFEREVRDLVDRVTGRED